MKIMAKFLRFGVVSSIVLTLVSGCASNTPSKPVFSPQTPSSPDKALIYFYRPPGESFGYDRAYFLAVNQRKVVLLSYRSYFPYETSPGKLSLMSDVKKSAKQFLPDVLILPLVGTAAEAAANPHAARLDIEVEAGKTYYVKMHPETSFTHFTPRLTVMTNEVAEKEIAGCDLTTNNP